MVLTKSQRWNLRRECGRGCHSGVVPAFEDPPSRCTRSGREMLSVFEVLERLEPSTSELLEHISAVQERVSAKLEWNEKTVLVETLRTHMKPPTPSPQKKREPSPGSLVVVA